MDDTLTVLEDTSLTSKDVIANDTDTDGDTLSLTAGKMMPGQIIKEESFSPFYENQSPKINPTTAEVVLKDGRESYLQYVYTTDMNATDTWKGESTVELSTETQNALAAQTV